MIDCQLETAAEPQHCSTASIRPGPRGKIPGVAHAGMRSSASQRSDCAGVGYVSYTSYHIRDETLYSYCQSSIIHAYQHISNVA